MATITKRNSQWRVQVRKKGISKSATFNTKADAVSWANKIESMIDSGEYDSIPRITFAELIDKYIKEVTITKKGARNEKYRLLRMARTPLGDVTLPELSKEDFRKWQNMRLKEVSIASVLRERTSLSAVITQAMQWDFLKSNPLKTLEQPKAPPPRTRRYSDNEIEKIVFVSGYNPRYQPITTQSRVGAIFLFALETAMRAGEICKLTWDCVDFTKRTAFLPETKNGYSRTVPLSTKAINILRHLELFQSDDETNVFRVNSSTLDATFRKLKVKAGLEDADLHFHDTRREALTRLSKLFTVMELAKISGHRDLSILQNTYYTPDISELAQKLL
ncbi:integrase [Pasteurellaceae bacterium LFhippo2]|nr:integrase [Pasteurellaceae bacterium LFhippo2]